MKNIMLIFRNNLRRGIIMIMVSIAAAALMIPSFSGMSKTVESTYTKICLGIIDNDESVLTENMTHYLCDNLGMEVIMEKDMDKQSNHLIDRKISAIIEVPQNFFSRAAAGELPDLEITTLDDYENAAFVEVYINSYMQSVQVLSDAAQGDEELFAKLLEEDTSLNEVTFKGRDNADILVAGAFATTKGFIIMAISAVSLFIAGFILSDRQNGTYSRILCSSIRSHEYVLGMAILGILCGTITNVGFDLYAYNNYSEIAMPMGISLLAGEIYVLFSIGFAIMLSLLVKTEKELFPVGIGYITFGCMLGGAWFPIADGLGALGKLARLFPQYWFMDMVRGFSGSVSYSCIFPMCILALFAVLAFLVSAIMISKPA